MMTLRNVTKEEVHGKRVLLRVDLDVSDDDLALPEPHPRIEAARRSIAWLQEAGARVLVLAHRGRPEGPDMTWSLQPVARVLAELLEADTVRFCGMKAAEALQAEIHGMAAGDACILENVRFHEGERANDPAFVAQLAGLADVFVFDAFGTAHRKHASVVGLAEALPSFAGVSLQHELEALEPVMTADRHPFVAIVGGAKLSSKLAAITALLKKADAVFVGGALATVFQAARGHEVGTSFYYPEEVEHARALLHEPALQLPVDVVVKGEDGALRTVAVDAVGAQDAVVDIGPRTIKAIQERVRGARLVLWNGPLGIVEEVKTRIGTDAVAHTVAEVARSPAYGVVGGGDTIGIPYELGVATFIDHISTGGGAMLQYVGGMSLPGLEVLTR